MGPESGGSPSQTLIDHLPRWQQLLRELCIDEAKKLEISSSNDTTPEPPQD